MFKEESIWIKSILSKIKDNISPVLNIGSSSAHFREVVQPFINDNIFKPLKDKNISVIHTDLQNSDGVDLVGDLTNDNFIKLLKEKRFKVVICSNLLEHLEESTRNKICKALDELLEEGGYLVLTVPHRYYYHPDPIDTLYRPSTKDLKKVFLDFEVIHEANVNDNLSYYKELKKRPKNLLFTFIKLFLPFYKFNTWKKEIWYLPNWFKPYQVSCLLLRKKYK